MQLNPAFPASITWSCLKSPEMSKSSPRQIASWTMLPPPPQQSITFRTGFPASYAPEPLEGERLGQMTDHPFQRHRFRQPPFPGAGVLRQRLEV